jgi:hypothetical protein
MTPERSEVQWGRTKISYTVQRSSRRATVAVTVVPSGSVVLTAPTGTPILRLDRVVRQKAPWIVERVRRRSAMHPPVEREFISGESFVYIGRSFRLLLEEHAKADPAHLESGHLTVTVPRRLGASTRRQAVRKAVVAWYRQHAKERLPERVALWADKLGVPVPALRLSEQRQRWGSCSPSGILRLNWRIMQAPMTLVDYVVAHELVHLTHRHHGDRFWAALGRVMPDYDQRRQALVELGASYVW